MNARTKEVYRRLMTCYGTHDHDKDWAYNNKKNFCNNGICHVRMCDQCAVRIDDPPTATCPGVYYCREHA